MSLVVGIFKNFLLTIGHYNLLLGSFIGPINCMEQVFSLKVNLKVFIVQVLHPFRGKNVVYVNLLTLLSAYFTQFRSPRGDSFISNTCHRPKYCDLIY